MTCAELDAPFTLITQVSAGYCPLKSLNHEKPVNDAGKPGNVPKIPAGLP